MDTVDTRLADAEAQKLLRLSADQFADAMLSMLYFKVLHPKGVDSLTIVHGDSVFSVGSDETEARLRKAKTRIEQEIARCLEEKAKNPRVNP